MQELLIDVSNNEKNILLVENGKLIEKYYEKQEQERLEGDIYLGIVENVLPGMQAAFVDIGKNKNTFIHIRDIIPKASQETGNKNEDFTKYNIKKYLKTGMPILVQVKKDSTNKKGARISAHLNFPGRFVVIMPNEKFVTLSQKIDDEKERERLKKIVKNNISQEYGAIVRTSAINKDEKEIIADIEQTTEKIKKLFQNYENEIKQMNNIKPKLMLKSDDIILRLITDLIDQNLERIVTNNKEVFDIVNKKVKELGKNIKIEARNNIFELYDLKKQLEEIESRKIWLKCGGFITIDKTEALTAIDVNSGKYTGKDDLEQTIVKVNMEATIEIAKQLRLRDIGGIIIIDYIDMQNKENEDKIINLFKEQLKKDRSKTQIVGFSKLNLLEMTRKHICSND